MKPTSRCLLAATAALLALAPTAAYAAPTHSDLSTDLHRVTAGGAAAALAEVRDGRHVQRAASGVARLGSDRPAPVDGRFRAGSITKSFVATVVLQLDAEHRLRLSDSVERWLPGVVPNGRNITLYELLNHTGSVPNVVDALDLDPLSNFLAIRNRTWTPRQLVDLAYTLPPIAAPPGTAWHYSDTDYVLLGMVVGRASGHDVRTEVQRRIIAPLRLRDTSLPNTYPRIDGPHPHGYVPVQRADGSVRPVDVTVVNPSVFGASGGLVSSTRDLNTFFAALLGGRLLPPDELARMRTTAFDSNYGLGLRALPLSCGTAWGHDGDVPGYSDWSYGLPEKHRQVTVAITPVTAKPKQQVLDLIDAELCR